MTGLIPAHAGKTLRIVWWLALGWAHPRSRGENRACDWGGLDWLGSSPLTRGKPRPRWPAASRMRLIPAHAGKTLRIVWWLALGWAHPRSRGENIPTHRIQLILIGSSPLTRGKREAAYVALDALGLIPAHAGKTQLITKVLLHARAHPRSRGENAAQVVGLDGIKGSSPLTRGKRGPPGRWRGRSGLIPAHAGKTNHVLERAVGRGAHPRSRGENALDVDPTDVDDGSSPLTRGKRLPGDSG